MQFVLFITGFTLGVLVALLVMAIYVRKLATKILSKKDSPKEEESESDNDISSVKLRMRKIRDLVQQQMDLQQAADGPQRNSLDGKYKNGLIGELKRIEEEKNEILRSIVDDGFNPTVTVMSEDGVKTISLVDFMAEQGYAPPTAETKEEPKTEEVPNGPRQVGKFFVYNGGKSDDDGTTH